MEGKYLEHIKMLAILKHINVVVAIVPVVVIRICLEHH